jgi:hypothetical protein
MLKKKIHNLLTLTFTAALLVSACGGEAPNPEAAIQTSVAATVAAQTPIVITETPAATAFPTQTPFATQAGNTPIPLVSPTSAPVNPNSKVECAKASLESETVVDGKIFKPGEQFTKTWTIKNISTCVWDTTYKIVFWDGDILGGGYVYQLPQVTGPGQTIPISLVLTTPTTPGTYRSEWKLQTPDNINFGVGLYQAAFWTEIVVANPNTPIAYDITSAELVITREPLTGCQPANMVYTANVTITTNGPLKVKYRIFQQDGNSGSSYKFELKEAGTYKNTDHVWKLGRAASQNSNRWMQIVIVEPFYREYPRVPFEFYCP